VNVILEKPFTDTLEEAEELFRIADERGCMIFEAITVLHNSVFEKMKEALPGLGPLRLMQANYSQYSSRYDRYLSGTVDPSFDPACRGGALRDINVYNIHFAVGLLGIPRRTKYYPNVGYNGVDTSGVLIMEYDGHTAVCTAAKDSDSPCFVSLQGEKGWLRVNDKPNSATDLTVYLKDGDKGEIRYREEPCHRMTKEFRDFARMIDSRDRVRAAWFRDETLDVMRVLQNISL
jgi:predicted dehydrogenase